jgi:hypothetical protein
MRAMRTFARCLALVLPLVLGCQASCRSASQGSQGSPAPAPPPSIAAVPSAGGPKAAPSNPTQAAPPAPTPVRTRPQTKQACDACGGLWDRHGIAETEGCICKTKDGGRACRDGAECEGQCLVGDDAKFEVAQPGPPARGFFVGRCSNYDTTFGCFRVIERGARAKGPQIEEEAAHHICVD